MGWLYATCKNLKPEKWLAQKSFFIFGPRATGKLTVMQGQLSDISTIIDLLNSRMYHRILDSPHELESIIRSSRKADLVVID